MQLQDTGRKVGAPTGKVAHTIDGACEAAGIGRSTLYLAIKNGDLRARKLGSRTLIMDEDLRAWLAALPPLVKGEA